MVKADGSVVFWGPDADGLAARPPSRARAITAPVVIDLPGKALQVALGAATVYALLEDGTVVAWGANDEGQLGTGAMGASGELGVYPKPSVTPVRVTGLTAIIQIEAGTKHAVALRRDGTVWAWGSREDGAIGDGRPTTLRPLRAIGPTQVRGLEGITQIAVARSHNLALKADGRVMSWGSNSDGELGIGTRLTGWTPAEVTGLDRVRQIGVGTSGFYHEKPVRVPGISNVSAVFLRGPHSFAARADGTVWIWGADFINGQGILGKHLHVPTLLDLR